MRIQPPPRSAAAYLIPIALLAGASLLSPLAAAADTPGQARYGSFGVGIGTGGLGVDYAYPITRYLDLRAGYDFGSLSRSQTEDDIEYDAKLKFSAAKLLADIKPFRGGFRITTGLYTGAPELELEANGVDDYDVGDATYRGDLRLDGDIDLGSSAPYLGIGWGGTAGTTGFGVSFDLGVIFADAPKVALDVTGRACDASADENCDPNGPDSFDVNDANNPASQQFQADKAREIDELEDDAKDFDMWPVIRLGLHYRF